MIVAEVARGDDRAEVDRVEFVHVGEIDYQAQRADPPNRVNEQLLQLDGPVGADGTMWLDDHTAVRTGAYLENRATHRITSRYRAFSCLTTIRSPSKPVEPPAGQRDMTIG